ncbi:MAG: 2-oxo acid dehydrogenase subunit E2 [Candidatus Niyogibacteria bacterium]|nr:2-oxo acid dehydrogenase subunit E2 [Candidatus Niyogibacteria bacterium]
MKTYIEILPTDLGTEVLVTSATIVAWRVKEGERIPKGVLVEIETEKIVIEREATEQEVGATLTKILVPASSEPVQADFRNGPWRLAEIEIGGRAAETPMPAEIPDYVRRVIESGDEEIEIPTSREARGSFAEAIATREVRRALASPLAKKIAKEHGIDLSAIQGEGPGGRVMMEQVKAAIAEQSAKKEPPIAEPPVAQNNGRIIKPSPRQRATARNLEAMVHVPVLGDDRIIDAEPLEELRLDMRDMFRRLHGIELRFDHFFGKAAAGLLSRRDFSILNSYWRDENNDIVVYPGVNLGMAVSVPSSSADQPTELIVVSVRGADTLGFVAFAREADRLIGAAKKNAVTPKDLSDFTVVINNVGSPVEWCGKRYPGSEHPYSLLSPRTAAIVSFAAIHTECEERRMVVALRADHRIVNREIAIQFQGALQDLLEHPVQILAL